MPKRGDSRLHAFSDAVFALSATLLVVTLEVPRSYDELLDAVAGFPAFAIGFGMLALIWYEHRRFFATYPLEDGLTVMINSVLLFIVLLYVYPLKLLTEVFAAQIFGLSRDALDGIGAAEIQGLFLIFGAGFVAVFAAFAALHTRAWLLRDSLGLDRLERFQLGQEIVSYVAVALVGVVSVVAAALGVGLEWGLPGVVYLFTGPVTFIHQWVSGRRRRKIEACGNA
jgi:uncharacterized membrane protein